MVKLTPNFFQICRFPVLVTIKDTQKRGLCFCQAGALRHHSAPLFVYIHRYYLLHATKNMGCNEFDKIAHRPQPARMMVPTLLMKKTTSKRLESLKFVLDGSNLE